MIRISLRDRPSAIMSKSLTKTELKIIEAIQHGLPATTTPYADAAREVGLTTDELLGVLRKWKEQGKLRRIGAIVNHFKVGLKGGAMVVWRVEPGRVVEVGEIFAGFEQVSHAYERPTSQTWPFSVYTMVHGQSDEEVRTTVEKMANAARVSEYRMLHTERELKKVPPTYVIDRSAKGN